MRGFSVDPIELHAAAATLSRIGSDLEEQLALRYSMDPREVGHHSLQVEIDEFQRQLAVAVSRLGSDTHEASGRLGLIATTYDESETARADSILDNPAQ